MSARRRARYPARREGRRVKRLIVTHPLFAEQYGLLSIDQLRVAADLGAYIEIIARNLARDGASKDRSIAAIRAIGAQHFFVASDAGLTGDLSHTGRARARGQDVARGRVSEADLATMYKDNPAFLVRLRRSARRSNPRATRATLELAQRDREHQHANAIAQAIIASLGTFGVPNGPI
jgi:hypothetical protein